MSRLDVGTDQGPAVAELHRPTSPRALAVLTHGSGGTPDTKDLLAVTRALTERRIAVALVTQPYVVAGRRTPPKPGPQNAAWSQILTVLRARRGLGTVPLIVGGRSNGARLAARTATAAGASACVALAFPTHPPGKPEKTRLDELDASGVPTLVVQGARDAFGVPPAAPGRDVVVLAGLGHTLARPAEVADAVGAFVDRLLGPV